MNIKSPTWENPKRNMMYIIENVNMSPVIMEKIIVTKGPVSLMALDEFNIQISDKVMPFTLQKT